MPARVWDPFLTASDKAHLAASRPRTPYGFGERVAVLSVDNYRAAVGDEPQPLLEAIRTWPSSTGLAAWRALDRIAVVFGAARAAGVPVIHITGLDAAESGMPGWRHRRGDRGRGVARDAAAQDRHRRRYDIVDQAAPLPGEVVLKKTAPSAFFGTPLAAHLMGEGIDTLIVVGEAVSGCVRATVVDGCSYRLRMIVVEDCVYDRHEATRAMNLFDIDQKYGDVVDSQVVLDWLSGAPAETPAEAPHAHSHSHLTHGRAETHELPMPQVLRAALPAGAEVVAVGHHPIHGYTIERAGSDVVEAARKEMSGGFGATSHLIVALDRNDVADEPELAQVVERTEGGLLLIGVGYRLPQSVPAPAPGPAGATDDACPECGSRSAHRDIAPESPGAVIYVCADCGAAWDA